MSLTLLLVSVGAIRSRVPHSAVTMVTTEKPETTNELAVSASDELVSNGMPHTPLRAARAFYSAWNHGDIPAASGILAENVTFRDINFPEPFVGRERVRQYLQQCTENLVGWQFCIDDYAQDLLKNTIVLRWHVNDPDGNAVPIPSRGLSFLKVSELGSELTEVTDINEPFAKFPSEVQTLVVDATAAALRTGLNLVGASSPPKISPATETSEPASMIEIARSFYDAWNSGSAEAASQFLADDVEFFYADFAAPLHGRALTHQFLDSCTVLLGGLKVIIDDYAEDKGRCKLGLKWHIEDSAGRTLPTASMGISFITFNEERTKMISVTDHQQPALVPPEQLQFPLAALASHAMEFRRTGNLPASLPWQ